MKDHIKEIIDVNLSCEENKNRIREYIQKYLLYILFKKKIYKEIVFTGGTALRIIHKIKRFSEDLDFSLSARSSGMDFEDVLKILKKELQLSGYMPEIKYAVDKTVKSAFLKFPGILFDYGLSGHADEKISVKIEVDTNPPHGGKEEVFLYNSIFMFYILHYDLPSLFAGKLHAVLFRKYTKGRDWYDLLWYLSKNKLKPNFVMLNNAIRQTSKEYPLMNEKNWKSELKKAIKAADIKKVRNDVSRFLDDPDEIEFLTKENLYKAL